MLHAHLRFSAIRRLFNQMKPTVLANHGRDTGLNHRAEAYYQDFDGGHSAPVCEPMRLTADAYCSVFRSCLCESFPGKGYQILTLLIAANAAVLPPAPV